MDGERGNGQICFYCRQSPSPRNMASVRQKQNENCPWGKRELKALSTGNSSPSRARSCKLFCGPREAEANLCVCFMPESQGVNLLVFAPFVILWTDAVLLRFLRCRFWQVCGDCTSVYHARDPCVYFCLYGPFNCISFHQFSRWLSAFSLCSSGLISAL